MDMRRMCGFGKRRKEEEEERKSPDLDMVKLFVCMSRLPKRQGRVRIRMRELRKAYQVIVKMKLRIV